MFDKMKQMYDMQKKAKELQKQLESVRVEKTSPDGRVRATVIGTMRVEQVAVDASLLAANQKDSLEDSIKRAVNSALEEIQKQTSAQAAEIMKGMGMGI